MPETQPNGAARRRLVEFLVVNSINLKKSDPSNGMNRVAPKVLHLREGWLKRFFFRIFSEKMKFQD